jgi:hypothetical protein
MSWGPIVIKLPTDWQASPVHDGTEIGAIMPDRNIPFSSRYRPKETTRDAYNSSAVDKHFLPPLLTKESSRDDKNAELRHEVNVERLLKRLPDRMQKATSWLRRPSSRWVRFPAGILLIVGGLLSFLPILGVWMLPLGLILLAEDVRPLRRLRNRMLEWIERHRPQWLANSEK